MRLKHRTALLIAAGYLLLAYVVYINYFDAEAFANSGEEKHDRDDNDG